MQGAVLAWLGKGACSVAVCREAYCAAASTAAVLGLKCSARCVRVVVGREWSHCVPVPLCRCGYVYCSSHRHANEHSCTFDYKSMDRQKLAQQNPTVAAARVGKI